MVIYLKFTTLLFFTIHIVRLSPGLSGVNAVCWIVLLIMAVGLKVRPSLLLVRNLPIMAFALIFSLFILLTGMAGEGIRPASAPAYFLKIVLMFNAVLLGGLWIGKDGFLVLAGRVPSQRVRLFLILFHKRIRESLRMNIQIIRQLKSRVAFSRRNRMILVRYYFQNMLIRELYAYRHDQAALLTRITFPIAVYIPEIKYSAADLIIVLTILVILIIGIL